MDELSSTGDSSSTKRMLSDAKKMFENFRNHSAALKELYPQPFGALGADILCDAKVYSQLANYMLNEYKKADGSQLDDTTIMPYLRALLRAAKDKFKPGGGDDVQMIQVRCSSPAWTGAPPPLHQGAWRPGPTLWPSGVPELHILPPLLPSEHKSPPLYTWV